MVAVPFLAAGGTSGDNADGSGSVGVSHCDDEHSGDQSRGVFSVFVELAGIGDAKSVGIGEDESCVLEADTVFSQIRGGLGGIPLEIHI